eukprot:scaffold20775_cov109-Isochrysis_galbana.AAC.7
MMRAELRMAGMALTKPKDAESPEHPKEAEGARKVDPRHRKHAHGHHKQVKDVPGRPELAQPVAVDVDNQLDQEDDVEAVLDRQERLCVLRPSRVDLGLLNGSQRRREELNGTRPSPQAPFADGADSCGALETKASHTHHSTTRPFAAAIPARAHDHGHP